MTTADTEHRHCRADQRTESDPGKHRKRNRSRGGTLPCPACAHATRHRCPVSVRWLVPDTFRSEREISGTNLPRHVLVPESSRHCRRDANEQIFIFYSTRNIIRQFNISLYIEMPTFTECFSDFFNHGVMVMVRLENKTSYSS